METNTPKFQKLLDIIENSNISIDKVIDLISEFQNYSKTPGINDMFIAGQSSEKIYFLVDYTRTLEQAIAESRYGWKNPNIISENFPISPEMIGKKIKVVARLYHFNYDISSKEAIEKMDKDGCRPATIMDLLGLGIRYKFLQVSFPVVALGSVWTSSRDNHQVPIIGNFGHSYGINLICFGGGWGANCRFLGIHK